MKKTRFVPALALSSLLVACGGTAPAEAPTNTAATVSQSDIVDTAVAAGDFKTLAAALKAADLIDTLKGPGPFTVFAPTDEAFAKLPAGAVDNLLKPENKAKLREVLTYHVVSGRDGSAQVATSGTLKSVEGADLKVTQSGGAVMINGAKVVKADIACSNGVIHVIDTVLMPN
jgi:uncharacterized surface protein with fasciclin (FAS1) repeats